MKQNKLTKVVYKSANGLIQMGDNWIIPGWKNYMAINQRTGFAHCLLNITIPTNDPQHSYIEVDFPESIQEGDLLEVMLDIPHTESETRGCQCNACKSARMHKVVSETLNILLDETQNSPEA
jgi:hypothetical protein